MTDGSSWPGAWGVLGLFLIPIGGGIPGGVLLARARGIHWPAMMALYLVSDVILAFVFEPIMKGFSALARRSPPLQAALEAMAKSARESASAFGPSRSTPALVLIAFGVDPMTGRAAAAAAGHGFVAGWAHAIAGDMIYFTVLMISTLKLNALMGGDPAKTVGLMLLGMMVIPAALKKWRERRAAFPAA